MFIFTEKYLLLRQVFQLWLIVVVLLLMVKYQIPNRTVHNVINICLALAGIAEFAAIIVISVRYVF